MIVFGMDSGVLCYGFNVCEFQLFVEVGMIEMEVIVMVMVNVVDYIEMVDDIGIIEVGKFVDIIVVDGNLFEDISELMDVDFVM